MSRYFTGWACGRCKASGPEGTYHECPPTEEEIVDAIKATEARLMARLDRLEHKLSQIADSRVSSREGSAK